VDGRFVGAYINNADGHVHFYQYSDELEEEQDPKRYDDNGVQLARDAKNVPGDDVGTENRRTYRRNSINQECWRGMFSAVSEPEEYWDDEGMRRTTTRRATSLHGRIDLVVIILQEELRLCCFLKMNQKVKKELAAATAC
jgi:hypothetical protein